MNRGYDWYYDSMPAPQWDDLKFEMKQWQYYERPPDEKADWFTGDVPPEWAGRTISNATGGPGCSSRPYSPFPSPC